MILTRKQEVLSVGMNIDKVERLHTLESLRCQIGHYEDLMAEMADEAIISLESYFEYHQTSSSILDLVDSLIEQMNEDPHFDGKDDSQRILLLWSDLRGELDILLPKGQRKASSFSAPVPRSREAQASCGQEKRKASFAVKAASLDDAEVPADATTINEVRKYLDYESEELMEQRNKFVRNAGNAKPDEITVANDLMTTIRLRIERLLLEVERETRGWIESQIQILQFELKNLGVLAKKLF